MKKSVLLVLASAALMMAACGGNKPTPSKSSPADTSEEGTSITTSEGGTSEGTSEEDVVCVESIGASASLSLEEGESVEFPVEISPANAPQGFTVTSNDDEVAYYDNGYVIAGKAGTATLTITSEGVDLTGEHLVTTTTVTVEKAVIPLPTIIDTDIEAAQAFTNSNENKIYRFSGILEGLSHTNKYGNAFVTDPASGKYVTIYGMTATAEGTIVWNEAGTALEYKNPKDAVTTLAEVNNGDLVTVYGIYTANFHNFSVILESSEAATTTYAASVTNESGVTLSKTSGLAYGEEVTISIVVPEGKVIDSVNVDHGYGTETVEAVEGVYKFGAKVTNEVTVVFANAAAPTGKVSYDVAANEAAFTYSEDGSAIGTSFKAASGKISGVKVSSTAAAWNARTGDNAWSGKTLVTRGTQKSTGNGGEVVVNYITLEAAYAFGAAEFSFQGWHTDKVKVTIERSADGEAWTADSSAGFENASGTGQAAPVTIATADEVSGKYIRLKVEPAAGVTAGKNDYNVRIGLFSFDLTYPAE